MPTIYTEVIIVANRFTLGSVLEMVREQKLFT